MVGALDPNGDVTVRETADLVGALAPDSALRLQQQQILRDAHRQRRTVRIAYQSTSDPLDGTIEREVSIWFMRLPKVQGWCHLRQAERIFRVDRMRSVEPVGHPYDVPDDAEQRV